MPDPAVDVHNDLYARLLAVASRFHTTVDIPGPFAAGDPAGVEAHNANGRAMLKLRDVANAYDVDPVVVISLPDVAHVGDTGHIADHVLHEDALQVLEAVVMPWEV